MSQSPWLKQALALILISQLSLATPGLAQSHATKQKESSQLLLQSLRLKVLSEAAIDQESDWLNSQDLSEDLKQILAEKAEGNPYPVFKWFVKDKPIEPHETLIRMVSRASMETSIDALMAWINLADDAALESLEILKSLAQKYPGLAKRLERLNASERQTVAIDEGAQLVLMAGLYIGSLENEIAQLEAQLLALQDADSTQLEKLRDQILSLTATVDQLITSHPLHVILSNKVSKDSSEQSLATHLWQQYQKGVEQDTLNQEVVQLLKAERPIALAKITAYLELLAENCRQTYLPLIKERAQILQFIAAKSPEQLRRYERADSAMSEELHLNFGRLQTMQMDELLWSMGLAIFAVDTGKFLTSSAWRLSQKLLSRPIITPSLQTGSRWRFLSRGLGAAILAFNAIDIAARTEVKYSFVKSLKNFITPATYATAITPRYATQLAAQNLPGILLAGFWQTILAGTFYARFSKGTGLANIPGSLMRQVGEKVKIPLLKRVAQQTAQFRAQYLNRQSLVGGAVATAGFLPILTVLEMKMRGYGDFDQMLTINYYEQAWKMITQDRGYQEDLASALVFSFFVGFLGEKSSYWQYAASLASVRMASNLLVQRLKNPQAGDEFDWYQDINWERVAMEGAMIATVLSFSYKKVYIPVRDGMLSKASTKLFGPGMLNGKKRPGWIFTEFLWNMVWCATLSTPPYVWVSDTFYNHPPQTLGAIPAEYQQIVMQSLQATANELGETDDFYQVIAADVQKLADQIEHRLRTTP